MADDLTGRWALARTGGLLPPLGVLHKRIRGDDGATRLGELPGGLPFRVEAGEAGPELVYRGPLRILRDVLRPGADGAWEGETRVLGVTIGRFRMTPDPGTGSEGPDRVPPAP